jgi:biopolymer transport protein ExbD/biopolymer transport protein TolR
MAISSPRRGNGLYVPVSDINVTPLVDVMLVLLIVFMITAPLLATGMRVNLPRAKSSEPLDPKEPVIVTVAKDGKIFVGQDPITIDELPSAVRAKLGNDPGRTIHVRGDREAVYGDMIAIMDRLAQVGLVKIALVANARNQPAPGPADPPAR